MLLKYFYDDVLAHASYLVACQKTGEAIVVDPGREIQQYLTAAADARVEVVAAFETHIHADYVSGARELATCVGAKLLLSDEGPADWKYLYANDKNSQLLKDGDSFQIGNITFDVLHTPGHTPESISLLLTDYGNGSMSPMGLFTGDFIFVGSVGRPDLLEVAAGIVGSADSGARDLYQSTLRFRGLPDYLQVWPSHGAGSACGKGLGAVPSSTVGYEKMFNPALQFDCEQEFVDYILAEQPDAPKYFAVMKRVNREGPLVLHDRNLPAMLDVSTLPTVAETAMIIDTAAAKSFADNHVPGTINIPVEMLARWAGCFVDYDQPLYLIVSGEQLTQVVSLLQKIGVDRIGGAFDTEAVTNADLRTQSYESASPLELEPQITSGEFDLLDVRSASEWGKGHIAESRHVFLGSLLERAHEFTGRQIVAQCLAGGRSAIAASILQGAGAEVINMDGGIKRWKDCKLPVREEQSPSLAIGQ